MTEPRFLVTGALGCIGAWTVYHLLQEGRQVVSFDIAEEGHRLDLLLSKEEQEAITFVRGDLAERDQVLSVFQDQGITHVIHLAALQVPFCKADPIKGAQVNVVGTVNIFEAARQTEVNHVTYASSIAVYGPPDLYPAGPLLHDALHLPATFYGVYKSANEGTARVYWQDHQISSTAFRPYTVYGVARDQGLTSDPTKAMLAAAAGKNSHINFSGKMQFHFASDVARQFIEAALNPLDGASVFNMGTPAVALSDVAAIIEKLKPGVKVTLTDQILPFPESFDDSELKRHFETVYETPLEDGIRQTITQFETCLEKGLVQA